MLEYNENNALCGRCRRCGIRIAAIRLYTYGVCIQCQDKLYLYRR